MFDEFNVAVQTFEAEVGKSYDVDPLLGMFGTDLEMLVL